MKFFKRALLPAVFVAILALTAAPAHAGTTTTPVQTGVLWIDDGPGLIGDWGTLVSWLAGLVGLGG